MGTMLDAVDPANIPAELDGSPVLQISVLLNPDAECFDVETGNASAAAVASVVEGRTRADKWSVVYCNLDFFTVVTAAIRLLGFGWATAESWPAPGCYLWAADPDDNIAAGRWTPGVTPLAVQDAYLGGYDSSTTFDGFPAKVAGYLDGAVSAWPEAAWRRFVPIDGPPAPAPQPAPQPVPAPPPAQPPSEVNVLLPILSEQNPGPNVFAPAVANLQALLIHHGFGVGPSGTDGRFGPATAAAVVACEHHYGLTVDSGIAGGQVWSVLLNR